MFYYSVFRPAFIRERMKEVAYRGYNPYNSCDALEIRIHDYSIDEQYEASMYINQP